MSVLQCQWLHLALIVHRRFITYRDYADAEYCPASQRRLTGLTRACRYRDFFRYTRDKLGDDRLIMSRRSPALCPPRPPLQS